MPVREFNVEPPAVQPKTAAIAPELVGYPGIDVDYVTNAESETYHYRGTYYTYFDNAWFRARKLQGPWTFIEMKYIPSDLFRVRGHVPPTVAR